MKIIGNHVHAAVLRAITAEAGLNAADRQKPILIVEDVRSIDWASATFIGARHEMDLRMEGAQPDVDAAIERVVTGLGERDIPVAGQIIAEIEVILKGVGRDSMADKRIINIGVQNFKVNVLTIVD